MKKIKLLLTSLVLVFVANSIMAQEIRVTGVVTDGATSESIPFATIFVKGATKGVNSDEKGKYSILVPSNGVLVFSSIGYSNKEVPVSGRAVINVQLESDAIQGEDVVVIGYGVVKKSELTGAISSVKSEEIAKMPVQNVTQALQGKVSGLQILSTSGRTGDETQISLRGNGSLRASNDVLYVIDGIPGGSFSSISPSDIESIEVLKDAASTAIYGSRASNGVILVTTKSGKYSQKTTVDFNMSVGFRNPVRTPKMLNAAQYKLIADEARKNYEADIAAGLQVAPKDPKTLTPFSPITIEGKKFDTDWFNEILNDDALTQSYQIGINGGGTNTKFYIGASHFNQEGIVKQDKYVRSTVKLNLDHSILDNLKIGVKTYFSASKSNPLDEDNSIYSPWGASSNARPDAPVYEKEDKLYRGSFTNPLYAFERELERKYYRLGGSAFLDWTIIDGLILHSSLGGNIYNSYSNRYDAADTKRGEAGGVPTGFGQYSTGLFTDYIAENTLTYSNYFFEKLHFTALVGQSYQKFDEETSYVAGENFPSTSLKWLESAGKITSGGSSYTANAMTSFFGRLQFNYDNRYNLMLSVRSDGSSKFLKKNRWGTFYAVSGGWTISNEDFWSKDVVNILKIRASYGQTGNQGGIGNASGQNLLGSGYNYYGQPGLAAASLFNENLTWERGLATNLGFDISFLDSRINLSLNYYDKTTKDLLYSLPVPTESGYRAMLSNVGEISNKGFEAELNTTLIQTKDFNWQFNANFSYNKNKIVGLGDPTKDYYTSGFVSIVKEGESIGTFQLIKALGVAKVKTEYKNKEGKVVTVVQPGDMLYEDVNGDGKITDDDAQLFSGAIAPIYGGLGTTISWKGFDLSLQAQYSLGKRIYAMYKESQMNGGAVGYPSFSDNMLVDILDRWTPTNTNTNVPRVNLGASVSSWNTRRSSRYLEDADYFRLTDITLGYNFKALDIPYFKALRIYVQARNLFTATKYTGLDPEISYASPDDTSTYQKITAGVDQNGIPNAKSITFGVNLSF